MTYWRHWRRYRATPKHARQHTSTGYRPYGGRVSRRGTDHFYPYLLVRRWG